ncbi:uncharacterized protein F4812DRAFT_31724 [Daldinia caldariorum]|uniref:uncharacterized protein n=1 Tax=Daldinia caldariorum TaxID=326644 RepID=UPI002008087D|nr:uncharacterized protein F4812DRAFT_31724 [Daldinia caldariorum]KAI1472915.1 hypothetical protein F4812DRAFT_31724 [Daldinia caldariorum]
MDQNLEDVLQQLHTALTSLNSFLKPLNHQTPTAAEDSDTSNDEVASPESDEWKDFRIPDEACLRKIGDAFIRLIERKDDRGLLVNRDDFLFDSDAEVLVQDLATQIMLLKNILTNEKNNLLPKIAIPYGRSFEFSSKGYPVYNPRLPYSSAPGRVINVSSGNGIIKLEEFAFLCNWLRSYSGVISTKFIVTFVEPWGRKKRVSEEFSWEPGELSPRMIFECHLRFVRHISGHHQISQELGILLNRERVAMRDIRHSIHIFYEERQSLRLEMVTTPGTIRYTLLGLGDNYNVVEVSWPYPKSKGILPCGKAVGIYHFQVIVCDMLDKWDREWTAVLDSINEAVGVRFNDTQDDEFMFDSSFKLSRLYFTVIQILRLMAEWIEESASDITQSREHFSSVIHDGSLGLTDEELERIEKNWNTISYKMDSQAKKLNSRIIRKTEEIKSLRDGLFNATSLRETSKAMALNRAIYVFTVVTIIYTPLGFMATFWALPVLNSSPNNETAVWWRAFISTFVLIPALTYIICPFAVWYFSLDSARRSLNSENIHKILHADFREIIRDSATTLPHKMKVWAFGDRRFPWRNSRPAMDSGPPAQDIEPGSRGRSESGNVSTA